MWPSRAHCCRCDHCSRPPAPHSAAQQLECAAAAGLLLVGKYPQLWHVATELRAQRAQGLSGAAQNMPSTWLLTCTRCSARALRARSSAGFSAKVFFTHVAACTAGGDDGTGRKREDKCATTLWLGWAEGQPCARQLASASDPASSHQQLRLTRSASGHPLMIHKPPAPSRAPKAAGVPPAPPSPPSPWPQPAHPLTLQRADLRH